MPRPWSSTFVQKFLTRMWRRSGRSSATSSSAARETGLGGRCLSGRRVFVDCGETLSEEPLVELLLLLDWPQSHESDFDVSSSFLSQPEELEEELELDDELDEELDEELLEEELELDEELDELLELDEELESLLPQLSPLPVESVVESVEELPHPPPATGSSSPVSS